MCLAISTIPIGIIGGIQGFQSDESLILIALIFGVTFCVSFLISFFISRPIEKLTKNIDEISKGKFDVNLESGEIYEINNLTESLNRVMASLKLAVFRVGVKKGEIFEDAVKAKETYEKKQQDLLNSINGWAWETDSKAIYTFVSKNVAHYLEYSPDELIGKSIFDLMDQEYVKNAKNAFSEAGGKKKPIKNLESYNISKNGDKLWTLINGVPFYSDNGELLGFRGVDTDITPEKEAYAKIKNLNTELSSLKGKVTELLNQRDKSKSTALEVLTPKKKKVDEKWSEDEFDSVFLLDENANILDCNDNMHKRLGYSKSEILSLNLSDIDALEGKKDIVNKIKKAKKDGVITFKTIHKRKDGSAILVQQNLQYNKEEKYFKGIVREDYALKKNKN